jgi:predicted CXXCH cytochrome family protein
MEVAFDKVGRIRRARQAGVARRSWRIALALALGAACASAYGATDEACLKCHAEVTQKKVVHAALERGCVSCHAGLTATDAHTTQPRTNKRRTIVAAEHCMDCHEKENFEGKFVHGPVTDGTCSACHDPHSSDQVGLLTMAPAKLCLDCHEAVGKGPHVVAGFSSKGHPLGDRKDGTFADDTLRPGKPFYCASCHEPHASRYAALLRFDPKGLFCQKCHEK